MSEKTYVASNGQVFTDADVLAWAAEAEAGFPGCDLIPAPAPWKRAPMQTRTFRTTPEFWAVVKRAADLSGVSVTEFTRQALAEHVARAQGLSA